MKTSRHSRRDFLKQATMLGGGALAFASAGSLSRLAEAAAADDLYFVFAYFSGGWDILLGLDPRDPARFNEDTLASTLIEPGYDKVTRANALPIEAGGITFGPFIGELARHANRLAVIRGMTMETLTHEAGRRRFLTGKPPSGLLARGSSVATRLASVLGRDNPIPNLAIQVESYNVDQPSYASGLQASGVSDLLRALRPANPALSTAEDAAIDALLRDNAACRRSTSSPLLGVAEAGRQKARDMTGRDLARLFDFSAVGPEMDRIRAHYGIAAGAAGLVSAEAQAAMAAQAIMGGVSRVVSIEAAEGLDTHFREWTTDQGPRQERGFNAVARLMDDLLAHEYRATGTSWLDHTVIVGFSEFSRTALLNPREGRDHSLTNACFVTGAKIKGGVVVGASTDVGLQPQGADLLTGAVDPMGTPPHPEHVLQTLLTIAGETHDEADLRVPPIQAILR